MKREEYDKAFAEYRAARERWKSLATQHETVGEGDWATVVSWGPSSSQDGGYGFSGDVNVVELSSAHLRRLADIKDDLARWSRNEGPWPLSKNTPAEAP